MRTTLSNANVLSAFFLVDSILDVEGLPSGPVKVPLARTRRALQPLALDVEQARDAIIRTYARKGDDGEPTPVPVLGPPTAEHPDGAPTGQMQYPLEPEHVAAAEAELEALQSATVEVEIYPPDLDRLGDVSLGKHDLVALLDLFDPLPAAPEPAATETTDAPAA